MINHHTAAVPEACPGPNITLCTSHASNAHPVPVDLNHGENVRPQPALLFPSRIHGSTTTRKVAEGLTCIIELTPLLLEREIARENLRRDRRLPAGGNSLASPTPNRTGRHTELLRRHRSINPSLPAKRPTSGKRDHTSDSRAFPGALKLSFRHKNT